MKTESKYLLLLLIFLSSLVAAQEPKLDTIAKPKAFKQAHWEGGFLVGASAYSGDLEFALANTRPIGGVFVRRAFGDYFALNASLFQGLLAGSEKNATEADWRIARNISFKSSLTELSIRSEFHFLGNTKKISGLSQGASVMDEGNNSVIYRKKKRKISPFIYAGGGLVMVNPKTDFNDSPTPNPVTEAHRISADKAVDVSKTQFVTPFGGGLRIPLVNNQTVITIEGGFRPTYSDYLDGMSIAGNPDKNDWYFVGGLGLSKLLGYTKDSDKDGIADKYDLCPYLKGDAKLQGCPDKDGDGITDDKDECPLVVGLAIYEGCPDTDGDGIIDKYDDCPNESGSGKFKGCPTEKIKSDIKKDTMITESVIALDTVKTKADTTVETPKPIEITQPSNKIDSLLLVNKLKEVVTPLKDTSQQQVDNPAIKPAENASVAVVSPKDKPKEAVTPSKENLPNQVDNPAIKPVENASVAIVSPKDKPQEAVTLSKETPPNQLDNPVIKPAENASVAIVSPKDKPQEAVTPSKETPQYQLGNPAIKPAENASIAIVSPKDKPKEVNTPSKETPKQQVDKPVVKPAENASLVVVSPKEKTKEEITPSKETPQYNYDYEKKVQTEITQSEFNKYLENASVADSSNNAFNIIRNHYTITPVYFETNKSLYKAESFVILDEVAYILIANPQYKLRIKGHTDGVGKPANNMSLSINRAKMCHTYLVRKGVPAKKMSFKGFGQTQPVADNDSNESRQLNRRVEFEIITED